MSPSHARPRRAVPSAVLALLVSLPLPGQVIDAGPVQRTLGSLDGPPGRIFDRIATVLPLDGDRLIVADGGSRQVRLYGEGPDPEWVFGREGQGPGEFLDLTWVAPYRADSLVAWDARQSRLTVLDGEGDLGRVITLGTGMGVTMGGTGSRPSPAERLIAIGATVDGGFVARRGVLSAGPGDTTAVHRDLFTYVLLGATGTPEREIVALPDDEQFVWATESSRSVGARAFGRTTAVVARGQLFAFARNDAFAAYTIDLASGAEPRRFADARDPVPVTAADRAAWLERNGAPDDLPPSFRASRQARLDAMPFPESMPFHGGLVLASDGAVWLEEWADEEGAAPVWTRFALDGGVDRIRFPDGFILHAVSAGRALGVGVGEFDVQRVVVMGLPDFEPRP